MLTSGNSHAAIQLRNHLVQAVESPTPKSRLANPAEMSNTWPRSVMKAGKRSSAREQPCTPYPAGGTREKEGESGGGRSGSSPGNRTRTPAGQRGRRAGRGLRCPRTAAGDYRPPRAAGFNLRRLRRAPAATCVRAAARPARLTRRRRAATAQSLPAAGTTSAGRHLPSPRPPPGRPDPSELRSAHTPRLCGLGPAAERPGQVR